MREPGPIDPRPPKPYRRRRRGQGLVEYSLLLALIGLVCIAIMSSTGSSTASVWVTANSQLNLANNGTAPADPTGGGSGSGGSGGGDHGGHDHDGHGWDGH
jgi:Flp pilus assembly pilin Flp